MTSSLVGSEMCIRDRSPSPWGMPSGSDVLTKDLKEESVMETINPGTSVSYTHLTLPTICSV
eukprot:1116406-Prorocentrum_lima.AAC.1